MNKLGVALIALLGAACAAFFGIGFGPGLLHDGRLMFAPKVEVQGFPDVSCRVYGGLFHVCSVDAGMRTEEVIDGVIHSSPVGKEQSAFFFGIGGSGPRNPGKVLAGADDSTQVTTGFSLRVFWSRVITFLAFEFIFIGMTLLGLVQVFARRGSVLYPD